ncbi:MAG: hypothetical protein V1836_00780, partial [Candidatus Aenigmatarchaeota archaeon]
MTLSINATTRMTSLWVFSLVFLVLLSSHASAVPPVLIVSNGTFTMNTSGLVGYWRFEQSNGSAATNDSSGYGNMGTLTNMNLTGNATSGLTQGRFGNALLFDGTNDYVAVASSASLNPTNELTFSVWFKKNGSYIANDIY